MNETSPTRPRRRRGVEVLLGAWMIGVMLLGYLVHEGPVVGSIVKRVAVLRELRNALWTFFGGG